MIENEGCAHVLPTATGHRSPGLVPRLSALDALAIGVGSVFGAGIFRTTGTVLRGAGSPLGATAVWIGCGVVAAAGARLFAHLSARVPDAGGPYAYVREAFGRRAGFVDGWLSAGVIIPARQAAGIAIIGEVLAGRAGGAPKAWSVGALAVLTLLTLAGMRAGATVQRALSTTKLLIAAAIVALAVHAVAKGGPAIDAPLPAAVLGPLPLSAALSGAFYTYLGWQDVAMLVEELKDPARDLRRVLVGTVGIVGIAYLAVHAALLYGLGDGAAARSELPALRLARSEFGAIGETFVAVALLVSMTGGAAESLLVRPRLLFALARDGVAPRVLAKTDGRGSPRNATLVHAALVLVLTLSGGFEALLVLLVVAQASTLAVEALAFYRLESGAGGARAAPPFVAAAVFTVAQMVLTAFAAWTRPVAAGVVVALGGALALAYGWRERARVAETGPEGAC